MFSNKYVTVAFGALIALIVWELFLRDLLTGMKNPAPAV